jgi:DNA-binding MarR family transcriptional regulator
MLSFEDLCQVKDVMATVVRVEAALRKETGLNLNQSFALCCLNRGPRSAGVLADELRIHGPSLSRILKALETKGYIQRDHDPSDNRQTILSLTEEGKRIASTLLLCENKLFPVIVEEKKLAGIG